VPQKAQKAQKAQKRVKGGRSAFGSFDLCPLCFERSTKYKDQSTTNLLVLYVEVEYETVS
jgi:hypothetical protein